MVEGDRATLRYIIVDDVIASGKTVQEIHKEIDKFAPQAKCIGVLQAYYFAKQDYSRDIFHTDITKRMEKKKAEEIASAVLKAVNVSKNKPKLLPPATLRTMLEIEWQARQFAKTQTVSPAPQKSKLYTSYPTIYNAGYEEIKWQTADGTPICKDANSWYKV
jgi:hypoxanthine phosphoribosyltransferase